jgi:choline dehydrogenase-like flavoprotein
MDEVEHDYIVVGSGAAGGTVAARLAEAGMRVLVIEAGPDPCADQTGRARPDYEVPAFHPIASESPDFAWSYWVSHFDDRQTADADTKCEDGRIYYPRAGSLGGCTAHNAMIFLTPPDCDWNWLAEQTGDSGWSAERMRAHRKAVERCRHRPFWRALAAFGIDPTGHGWQGWLPVEKAVPRRALGEAMLIRSILWSALVDLGRGKDWLGKLRVFLTDWGDPNDARRNDREQLCYAPLATLRHSRRGTRERLIEVRERHRDRLRIETDCLATRILFDAAGRASGVAWRKGRHLYRAGPDPNPAAGEPGEARARREVILAGGAFATPQLLMLSGIGEAAQLKAFGIEPRADLPEVGRNLQDRYEIGLVYRMARPWLSLEGARFMPGDPLYRAWQSRRGMYISNGTVLAALRRSSTARDQAPDLFLMGLMARFRGYYRGYSNDFWPGLDGFSWTVLKGQTGNRAGSVRLASPDPRDPPRIDLRNFDEGGEADLTALVEGLEMARALAHPLVERGVILEEETPGAGVTGEALRQWVRSNAWGHHACGTAAIGPVLDPQGRVHGVAGLRVVDASLFPRIPGLFIAASIYFAAEKLAADILLAARGS